MTGPHLSWIASGRLSDVGRVDCCGFVGRALALLLYSVLIATTQFCAAAEKSPSRQDRSDVTLATQGLVPTLLKSDWAASSFSPDGRFLLVVDEFRSLIVDAVEGRELRGVQLPPGETALWSRPVPGRSEDYRWLVATNGGQLLDVDGTTGSSRLLAKLPVTTRDGGIRSGDIAFEFASDTEVIVHYNRITERKRFGTTRVDSKRQLMLLSLTTGSTRPILVPVDLYQPNLTSFLSVNPNSRYLALASNDGWRVLLWTFDTQSRNKSPFAFACLYDGDDRVLAIEPLGRGFLVVNTEGEAIVLDPERDVPASCAEHHAADLANARCKLGVGIAALAGRGRRPTEVIAVSRDYTAHVMDFSQEDCAYTHTSLGNVKHAYFDAPVYGPADLESAEQLPERSGFVAAPQGDSMAMVAGASLLRLSRRGTGLVKIQSLVGRPSGAYDVEAGSDFILASRLMAPLRAFDVSGGRLRTFDYDFRRYFDVSFFHNKPFAVVSGLRAIAVLERDGRLRFHEAVDAVDTSTLPKPQQLAVQDPSTLCSSGDGRRLWVVTSGEQVRLFDLDDRGAFAEVAAVDLGDGRDVFKIACDESGRTAVAADSLSDTVFVLEARGDGVYLVQQFDVPQSSKLRSRPALSADGGILSIGSHLYLRSSRSGEFKRSASLAGDSSLVLNRRADRLAAIGSRTILYEVRRNGERIRLSRLPAEFGAAEEGAFVGDFLFLVRGTDRLDVVSQDARQLGRLVFGDDNQWLFTDSEGRFDTYDLEGRASAYWVMQDDPMRALDPEMYMRDYFEPRLLPRLMDCIQEEARRPYACSESFPSIRSVSSLNRARPKVEFDGIEPDPGQPDKVRLRLSVQGMQEPSKDHAIGPARTSGAFDLHVRLDGQLIARHPVESGPPTRQIGRDELAWRESSRLLDGTDRIEVTIPNIALPHRESGGQVEFSTYAFNDDRVKGPTRSHGYSIQAGRPAHRRAFVVAIGSSAYEDQRLDLRYPAEDARKLIATVVPALQSTGRFDEIVPLALTSEWVEIAAARRIVSADTTKERIRQLIESISGSSSDPLNRHAPSTPDDTVIILFAGHGVNIEDEFFLVPYDSGQRLDATDAGPVLDLAKQISSAELAFWMRDLVADEIILVIDACHSSASVESPDFKPGPMGDRGFGQLAYDKGMRVLSATRPNDLAWESRDRGMGLLSHALLEEGLVQRKADRLPKDGTIMISEWLQFAVDRVPALYAATAERRQPGEARIVMFDAERRSSREVLVDGRRVQARTQQPSVFNFRRRPDTPLSIPKAAD